MNEIIISKKHLFIWLLVILLLVAVGFGIYSFRRFLPGQEAAPQPVAAASLTTPDDGSASPSSCCGGCAGFLQRGLPEGKTGLARPAVRGQHEHRLRHGSERFRPGIVAPVGSSQNKHDGPGVGAREGARPGQPTGRRSPAGLEAEHPAFCALAGSRAAPDQFPGAGVGDA